MSVIESPLRRLYALWEHVSIGNGGGVALAGEPGIGKTRLTARVAARAHGDGAVVLHGRADEEGVSPYQPFVEALRQYAAHRPRLVEETPLPTATAQELAGLIPELGAPSSAAMSRQGRPQERSRYELFDAVVRLLLHAANAQRLLLILDDLHWADLPTLSLLRQIVRRISGSPLLVIVTYSDLNSDPAGPLTQALSDLRREAAMETIRLEGLRRAEVV